MNKPRVYFAIFFLLLAIYVVIQSLFFRRWESMVLPLFLGGIMLIMSVLDVAKEMRSKGKVEKAEGKGAEKKIETSVLVRRFTSGLAWVIGFSLAVYLIGFLVAMPVFSIAYMKVKRQSWSSAIIVAVINTAFVYGTFELALKSHLYPGLVFELLSA